MPAPTVSNIGKSVGERYKILARYYTQREREKETVQYRKRREREREREEKALNEILLKLDSRRMLLTR